MSRRGASNFVLSFAATPSLEQKRWGMHPDWELIFDVILLSSISLYDAEAIRVFSPAPKSIPNDWLLTNNLSSRGVPYPITYLQIQVWTQTSSVFTYCTRMDRNYNRTTSK